MNREQGGNRRAGWAALCCALLLSGCASLQMPAIDPSGQQLFTTAPGATPGTVTPVVQPSNCCCNLFSHAQLSSLHQHLGCSSLTACCTSLFDHSCCKQDHWANLLNHGWCGSNCKQPCGPVLPGSAVPLPPPGLSIAPNQVIAPVGSEVVMLASIHNQDGRPAGNQQVEWMLAPNGVGFFLARSKQGHDWDCFPSSVPRKVANDYALANTSNRLVTLTRGTPTPLDDVPVALGQAWISVSSPTEGTSYVTAFAPRVSSWDQHQRTGVIHWVDAQWNPPLPAVNPVGTQHALTTSVFRQTDRQPIGGWQVRYEIVSGPPAQFENGAQAVEITTNDLGQATAVISQAQPSPGTNQINVRLIRPVNSARGDERPLVIGNATTQKTWTSPEIAVRVVGPSQASLGATASFQVQVSNPGDLPARGVVVTVPTPSGLTFLSSTPPAPATGNQVEFQLLDLAAKQSQTIALDYRIDGPGQAQVCASVRTAEGLSAQDCVTTALTSPTLSVSIVGPDRGVVGQNLVFEIVVSNTGAAPASKLVIIDTHDPGLQHQIQGKIEKELQGVLGPGQSQRVGISFTAAAVGRQCHTVEVVGEGGTRATAQACVDITQGGGAAPVAPIPNSGSPNAAVPPANPAPSAPSTSGPGLSVRNTGPSIRNVGEVAEFVIDVTNTGESAQQGLKLSVEYDPALLKPEAATKGIPTTGELIWDLPTLLPAQIQRFRIQCRCLAQGRACNMATVTAANGLKMAQEACVDIRGPANAGPAAPPAEAPAAETGPALSAAPAAASLEPRPPSRVTLAVAEQNDPVRVGSETTFVISVRNPASYPDQQVQLKVAVPAELQLLSGSGPTRNRVAGQTITFEPIAELRAGETIEYRLKVKAASTGNPRLDAQVTSRGLAQPLLQSETTLVVGG